MYSILNLTVEIPTLMCNLNAPLEHTNMPETEHYSSLLPPTFVALLGTVWGTDRGHFEM